MRTNKLAVAVVLATAALAASAAENRMEPINSPFTYEALGATPALTLGRAKAPAAAPQAAQAPKAAATRTVTDRATGMATGTTPFTYESLGATPHVQLKQPAKTETLNPAGR